MPTERPIIPKGMPNPIGRAVFEGTKNPRRIGGELPVYKYPLVSKAPKQFSNKAKLVSTNQVDINFPLFINKYEIIGLTLCMCFLIL